MNPASLKGRSLLSWINYSPEEIRYLLETAVSMRRPRRRIMQRRRFGGKSLGLLCRPDALHDSSSEVRAAFDVIMSAEGGHCVDLPVPASMDDAARTLGKMFDALAFSGGRQEELETLARCSGVPVFNMRTDAFEPLRALALVSCIESMPGGRTGRKCAFVGDGRTAIARSILVLCTRLGIDCSMSSPSALLPGSDLLDLCKAFAGESGSIMEICASPEAAVKGAGAVVTAPWLDQARPLAEWQVVPSLMDATGRKDSVFIHAEPLRRGDEVHRDVFESPASKSFLQGDHIFNAVRALLLASL
jgi:ornithine carbamoyltransferase